MLVSGSVICYTRIPSFPFRCHSGWTFFDPEEWIDARDVLIVPDGPLSGGSLLKGIVPGGVFYRYILCICT